MYQQFDDFILGIFDALVNGHCY